MARRTRPLEAVLLVFVVGALLLACKKKRTAPPAPATSPAPAQPAAGGFAGNYTITSAKNPDGTSYTGNVSVSGHGDYDVLSWTITSGGGNYSGVGIEMDGLLGVGWGKNKPGVVVYKVDGGTLNGKWTMTGATGLGTEVLSGPAGVSGKYTITSSSSPQSGKAYRGSVTITPKGALRMVRWSLTSGESYAGVGILDGDKFVVGWGTNAGAVVYHTAPGSGLTGRFASPGVDGIGNEVLARK